jgi:hypothetical protein
MGSRFMSRSRPATPPVVSRVSPKRPARSALCPSVAALQPRRGARARSLANGGDGKISDGADDVGGSDSAKLALRGRFNASPKSVYRALTEYDGVQHMSHSIVSCKRMWISSRVGRTVLRLQSRDRNLLWGTMVGDIIVEVEEDLQKGEISFRAENVGDRAAFAVQG